MPGICVVHAPCMMCASKKSALTIVITEEPSPSPEPPQIPLAEPHRPLGVVDPHRLGELGLAVRPDPGDEQQPPQHDERRDLRLVLRPPAAPPTGSRAPRRRSAPAPAARARRTRPASRRRTCTSRTRSRRSRSPSPSDRRSTGWRASDRSGSARTAPPPCRTAPAAARPPRPSARTAPPSPGRAPSRRATAPSAAPSSPRLLSKSQVSRVNPGGRSPAPRVPMHPRRHRPQRLERPDEVVADPRLDARPPSRTARSAAARAMLGCASDWISPPVAPGHRHRRRHHPGPAQRHRPRELRGDRLLRVIAVAVDAQRVPPAVGGTSTA